jgi:hypothetical protein
MTHFTVAAIIPADKLDSAAEFAERQMAPYCEHIEVAPYVCYSIEQARADIERDIRRFERIIERRDPEYNLDRCRELLDQLRSTTPEQRYQERMPFFESFNDHGQPLSTYNPDSKWDWYVIGGRWDGWINDRETSGEQVADNLATTESAVERGKVPHAILTPDGQWRERGQMGWWAVLITENEDWDAQAKEILSRYPGHHVLILDAHI